MHQSRRKASRFFLSGPSLVTRRSGIDKKYNEQAKGGHFESDLWFHQDKRAVHECNMETFSMFLRDLVEL